SVSKVHAAREPETLSASGQHPAYECSEREIPTQFKEALPFVPSIISGQTLVGRRANGNFPPVCRKSVACCGRNTEPQSKRAPGKELYLVNARKKLAIYLSLVAAVTFPAASLATSSTLFVASLAASFTVSAALSIAWPAFSMALSTSFPARSAGPSPAFFPHPARLNPSKMAVTIRQPFL